MIFGRFPSQILYKYPRMSPRDTIIWRKFLQAHQSNYNRFDYDFPVGPGEDPGAIVEEKFRKDFIDLTRKRIDAVGYNGNAVTLFEVKPRAGTQALGQLLTYGKLFTAEYSQFSPVTLAVVCEFINTDERAIYQGYNINIYVFT